METSVHPYSRVFTSSLYSILPIELRAFVQPEPVMKVYERFKTSTQPANFGSICLITREYCRIWLSEFDKQSYSAQLNHNAMLELIGTSVFGEAYGATHYLPIQPVQIDFVVRFIETLFHFAEETIRLTTDELIDQWGYDRRQLFALLGATNENLNRYSAKSLRIGELIQNQIEVCIIGPLLAQQKLILS